MKSKLLRQILAFGALLAGPALAAIPSNAAPALTDTQIAQAAQRGLLQYGNFTVFDDLSFKVQNGQITLTGKVTEPYKRADLEKIAARVPGVAGVTDQIQVLPFSDRDNLLRSHIATLIYHDPSLAAYRAGANSPIHIIVDNGRVTLTGAVRTQADKQDAGLLASDAAPTVNNLQVAGPTAITGEIRLERAGVGLGGQ